MKDQAGEISPVLLPSMGEGIQEATIVKWLKKKGERVHKNAPLLEITTDKVDTEISSPSEGFLLATTCEAGDLARVGQVIAFIGERADLQVPDALLAAASQRAGGSAHSAPKKQAGKEPSSRPTGNRPSSPAGLRPAAEGGPRYISWVRASPLVRSIAKEQLIPLAEVSGSGLHGRITRDDILHYMEQHPASTGDHHPASGQHSPAGKPSTYWQGDQEFLDGTPVHREKMSTMRRLTAAHMLRSVATSPHVTTTFEIDLIAVKRAREARKDAFYAAHGLALSYTPFFIYAAARALAAHPEVNTAVDGDEILWRQEINIGCAVATPKGLIVPVLKGLARANVEEIARSLGEVVSRAREGKLLPEEVRGGTFTLTNPGMFGSLHSQPIINQPQVAILSIGAIIDKPVVVAGEIVVRPLCQVGLTFDHRIIDGEGGAKFLATLRDELARV